MPRKPITPSTTTIAAFPRRMRARSSSHVTGVWSTIARKSAMKTHRTACRAATKAQTNATTARTVAIVRAETVISTRFGGGSGTLDTVRV